jgi:hypothetical protein
MKKSILAISTAALSLSAMAATTNTITTSTKSGVNKFIESTKASVYMDFNRANVDSDQTNRAQYLTISNTINSDLKSSLQIRTLSQDVAGASYAGTGSQVEENALEMIGPRLTISGYSQKIKTDVGEITISPALRTQFAVNAAADDKYATLRLGVSASMNTNAANNIGVFAGTYERITKSNAKASVTNAGNVYIYAWDEYSINDKHSVTGLFENYRSLDQKTLEASNNYGDNDASVYYNNKTIKDLTLSPYVSHNLGNDLKADLLKIGVEGTYSF